MKLPQPSEFFLETYPVRCLSPVITLTFWMVSVVLLPLLQLALSEIRPSHCEKYSSGFHLHLEYCWMPLLRLQGPVSSLAAPCKFRSCSLYHRSVDTLESSVLLLPASVSEVSMTWSPYTAPFSLDTVLLRPSPCPSYLKQNPFIFFPSCFLVSILFNSLLTP